MGSLISGLNEGVAETLVNLRRAEWAPGEQGTPLGQVPPVNLDLVPAPAKMLDVGTARDQPAISAIQPGSGARKKHKV